MSTRTLFDTPRPGDVVRLKKWENWGTNGTMVKWSPKSRKEVGVFIMIGHEPLDGSAPLDVDKRLNELGWTFKETVAP